MLYPLVMLMSFFTVCDNFTKSNVMILLYVQQLITWCRSQQTLSLVSIFTARKWSLGQGNVFTPVCHSVHRGCVSQHSWGRPPLQGRHALPRQTPPPHSDTTWYSQQVGGTHPTGMHTCLFSEYLVIHLCIPRLITFVEKSSALFDCEHYNS